MRRFLLVYCAAGGLLIAAIPSMCYVATSEVTYFKLAPDFVDKYSAHGANALRAKGASAQEAAALRTRKRADAVPA